MVIVNKIKFLISLKVFSKKKYLENLNFYTTKFVPTNLQMSINTTTLVNRITLKKKNYTSKKNASYIRKVINLFFPKYRYVKNFGKKRRFLEKLLFINDNVISKINSIFNVDKIPFARSKKNTNIKNSFYLLKKKIKIEKYLNIFIGKKVELKIKNFLKSSNSCSSKFKYIYKKFYNSLRLNKINFFNRQFKEIYSSTALSLYLSKAKMLVYLFALVIGYGRYRLLKKNLYYLFNIVESMQKIYAYFHSIRINISGKFKGKAKRTQLKYLKTRGMWEIRNMNESLIDYHVGFVATRTGIFGIKVWIN